MRVYFEKFKESFLLITITLIVFESCREEVTTEFEDFLATPVVNSILIADSTINVHVSMTGKVNASQLEIVENADILLFVNGHLMDSVIYKGEGIYFTKTVVAPGKTYSCEVSIPGFPLVRCSDSISTPVAVSVISYKSIAGRDEEGISYSSVTFTFFDDPLQRNFYEAKIRLLIDNSSRYSEIINISDPLLLNEGLPMAVFSDELIDNGSYTMTLNFYNDSYGYGDSTGYYEVPYPFQIELRNLSFNFYQYVKQLYLYESGRYPDIVGGVVTPFQLHSNVENGYGIFAGYSTAFSDTIFSEPVKK